MVIKPTPIVQVVIQSTPFCNIDCSYCYLQDRTDNRIMSEAVVRKLFQFIKNSQLTSQAIDFRWHAGEPLVAGIPFYYKACDIAENIIGDDFEFQHSIQTNGILLSPSWCQLFNERKFRVGISIDGPPVIHDAHRLNRKGDGTFDLTLKGINVLRENGLEFDTISVVTPSTLDHQAAFQEFFTDLSPRSLGLNIEESEGENISVAFEQKNFIERINVFLTSMLEWENKTNIPVREIDRIRRRIFSNEIIQANDQNQPMSILTVDVIGNIYTFSPELAGLRHVNYDTFKIGNIFEDSIDTLLRNENLCSLTDAIFKGVEKCRQTCEYFQLCGGGAPSNKLFENNSFESTETSMCYFSIKSITDILLTHFEERDSK